ncbi:MAG: YraN family protein [Thiovulaceae bacterium]|nr:YraN family protein [Sulfurimonadaceae bacterium]
MSRAKGTIAEEKACNYLRASDFDIIDRNVYSRFGEIDIIALKNEVLHFVEVKSGSDYEGAVQNITPTKLRRFLLTVQSYLKKHKLDIEYCVDGVIVTPDEVTLLENITL